jgi:hypothetical protein
MLECMLFELTPLDPWTFLAVVVTALVVAVLAPYQPPARASRVDPLAADFIADLRKPRIVNRLHQPTC